MSDAKSSGDDKSQGGARGTAAVGTAAVGRAIVRDDETPGSAQDGKSTSTPPANGQNTPPAKDAPTTSKPGTWVRWCAAVGRELAVGRPAVVGRAVVGWSVVVRGPAVRVAAVGGSAVGWDLAVRPAVVRRPVVGSEAVRHHGSAGAAAAELVAARGVDPDRSVEPAEGTGHG